MQTSRILHVDADNFFASCEEILSPALRGRAVMVSGGRRQNGFVLSANRRAKQLGIKSGMACFMARRLCADLVCCPARVTFGDVARLPSMLLRQRFGIWGQKLWLFACGQWSEKLVVEVRTRTMISRQKTFSFDVHDYGRVQQFGVVEVKKLLAQLRREQLAPREMVVAVRFADFSEAAAKHRFSVAQERDGLVCAMFAAKFAECVAGQEKLVRQLRLALAGLEPRPAQQTFWD